MQSKEVLRTQLLEERKRLSPAYMAVSNKAITRYCIDVIKQESIICLHTYLPIISMNEVNTWPVLRYVWQHHSSIAVVVPVFINTVMRAAKITPETTFETGLFGTPKPLAVELVSFDPDFVIVPTLGFDARHNRLGYGKGYYDRLLAQTKAISVGLAYGQSEVSKTIPVEPHDQPLDYIITNNGILS